MADAEILARYVKEGVLRQYPAKAAARSAVLLWLAGRFAPDCAYSEAEVNDLLRGHKVDHATLRRYLVDAGLLERGPGYYRRAASLPHSD